MPDVITVTKALEVAPKIAAAVSNTNKVYGVLSSVAKKARFVGGEWIPEAVSHLPGIKQGLGFFGKTIEKPLEAITHRTISSYLTAEVKKQLRSAKDSLTKTSMFKSAVTTIASQLPAWVKGLGEMASPLIEPLSERVIESLATKMVAALDPIVCAPTADCIAKNLSYLASESAKLYIGHGIQTMAINFLAEQFKETNYRMLSTSLEYAKKADDIRVLLALFTVMLAANLLPHFIDKLQYRSIKDEVKAKLKQYVLEKSEVDPSGVSGKIYSLALDTTLETLINSKMINVNQVKLALASIQVAEAAVAYAG